MSWPWTAEAIGWGRVNQRRIRAAQRLQQGWPNPISRARLYEEALKVEGSYGKVARRFGVSREKVCHYVTLVKRLPEDVVTLVDGEQDPARVRRLNLRTLLRIARLDTMKKQRDGHGRASPKVSPQRCRVPAEHPGGPM
jgi:hypothetical protein